MKKHITLKMITLTSFCLFSMSCSADKSNTQEMQAQDIKTKEADVNAIVEKKLVTKSDDTHETDASVTLEVIAKPEAIVRPKAVARKNGADLQAENFQLIHTNTMSLEAFFEQFKATIKGKDRNHLEVISDIGSKSSYTIKGLTTNFDDIFHADLIERLVMSNYQELKDRTLPNGQEGKVFAYDFEDIEDETINLATFLYFQETTNGWKLVNVDVHSKELCVNEHTVFSCTTKSNKIIKVCEAEDVLTYSYGRKDKPELTLKRPLKEVAVSTSAGSVHSFGYNYDYGLEFKNATTVYTVYSSKESGANGESAGGVTVEHGDKMTDIPCARSIYDDSFHIIKPHMQ